MTDADMKQRRKRHDLDCTTEFADYQKQWFANLHERVARGEPCFLAEAQSPHEIIESFGIPFVTNEWWSGIVASQRRSPEYFRKMEQHGYHKGLERYPSVTLASALGEPDDPPWGGLPRPTMAVYSSQIPTRVDRWEQTAKTFGAPGIGLNIPDTGMPLPPRWWEIAKHGWEELCPTWQLDHATAEFWRLIRAIEAQTGIAFDHDAFRDVMDRANRQQEIFAEMRDAMIAAPRWSVSLPEMLRNVMTIQWHRGTPWAVAAATKLRDAVLERIDREQWICPNECFRLAWVGPGLWQNTAFYRMFEASYGAIFVQSMYLSIAIDGYPRYGQDPVRALASRYCAFGLTSAEWIVADAKKHGVDGAITVVGGSGARMRRELDRAGIPLLTLDVDLVDGRSWNEDAVQAQMQAFIADELEPRAAAR